MSPKAKPSRLPSIDPATGEPKEFLTTPKPLTQKYFSVPERQEKREVFKDRGEFQFRSDDPNLKPLIHEQRRPSKYKNLADDGTPKSARTPRTSSIPSTSTSARSARRASNSAGSSPSPVKKKHQAPKKPKEAPTGAPSPKKKEKKNDVAKKLAGFSFAEPTPEEEIEAAANDELVMSPSSSIAFATVSDGKKVNRRSTVACRSMTDDEIDNFKPEVHEKDDEVREWLLALLEDHELFSHLERKELLVVVDALVESVRGEGEHLFEEARDRRDSAGEDEDEDEEEDEPGDLFFIVGSGKVQLSSSKKEDATRVLRRGDTTQDTMLLHPAKYQETAEVLEDETTIFTLDRLTYRCIVAQASKRRRAQYEGFLHGVGFLKSLEHLELLQLADALKADSYEKGQKLIRFGQRGETFFLIIEGTVDVYGRNEAGESIFVCDFKEGDCVGELEFINDHNCVADVVAHDDTVRVAKMNRHHFEMVMGPVKSVLARNASENEKYGYYRQRLEGSTSNDVTASSPTKPEAEAAEDAAGDEEEQSKAAMKIQAVHRGRQARKQVQEMKKAEPKDEEEGNATAEHDEEDMEPQSPNDDEEEQTRAAMKIQAVHRGRQARKQVQEMQKDEEDK